MLRRNPYRLKMQASARQLPDDGANQAAGRSSVVNESKHRAGRSQNSRHIRDGGHSAFSPSARALSRRYHAFRHNPAPLPVSGIASEPAPGCQPTRSSPSAGRFRDQPRSRTQAPSPGTLRCRTTLQISQGGRCVQSLRLSIDKCRLGSSALRNQERNKVAALNRPQSKQALVQPQHAFGGCSRSFRRLACPQNADRTNESRYLDDQPHCLQPDRRRQGDARQEPNAPDLARNLPLPMSCHCGSYHAVVKTRNPKELHPDSA